MRRDGAYQRPVAFLKAANPAAVKPKQYLQRTNAARDFAAGEVARPISRSKPMQCPRPTFRSHNISSNKFKDETYKQIFHAGHASHQAGFHSASAGAIALIGLMKLADRFVTDDWVCDTCGNTFS